MPSNEIRQDSGFTLTEVLVAFAILSVSLIVLFKAVADGAHHLKKQEQKMAALTLAQSQMARLGLEIPLKQGVMLGTFDGGISYEIRIHPSQSGPQTNPASDLSQTSIGYWVSIKVYSGPERAGEPLITLETLKIGAGS